MEIKVWNTKMIQRRPKFEFPGASALCWEWKFEQNQRFIPQWQQLRQEISGDFELLFLPLLVPPSSQVCPAVALAVF